MSKNKIFDDYISKRERINTPDHWAVTMLKTALISGFIVVLAVAMAVSGCSTQIKIPINENTDPGCQFDVIDERTTPKYLYFSNPQGAYKLEINPRLDKVIRHSVCNKITVDKPVTFHIEDYQCVMSGFYSPDFIVTIRGRIDADMKVFMGNGAKQSIQNLVTGCQIATHQAVNDLTRKIIKHIK